jgi:crotonobetainyl-CoA:carnitine CoA-transferase CaiB-like acyl-CoA transferase
VLTQAGHDSEWGCPHGVYAAAGVERYVAIETRTPEQWRALCAEVPDLAGLGGDDLPMRIARRGEIDAALAAWCAERDAFELAERLREAGVPAYAVLRATDFHADPQLAARGFFIELDHPVLGRMLFDGPVTTFSRTPARARHAGAPIGQHTFEVMRDVLGYDEDEIAEIAATGTLT